MSDFNPDQYLAEKTSKPFDPDAYLSEKVISPEQIEEMRPKNLLEQGWTGLKNLAAGALKSPLPIAAGIEGLAGKALDKLGVTKNAEARVKEAKQGIESGIDRATGAGQPGYELAQGTGQMLPQMAIPFERAVPLVAKAAQFLRLPPSLASFAGKAGVNAGVGAIEGENSGHPLAGAIAGAGATGLGELAKAAGGQIIKSYIKGGHRGAAEGLDVPWFLNKEMGGSAHTMTANAENALSKLRTAQDAVVTVKGQVPVNGLNIFHDIDNQINASPAIARNLGAHPAAQAQLNKYFDDYAKLADPVTGEVPLHLAWEMKKRAGSDAADLYKAARIGGDVKSKTAQGVSALVASKFNEALEKAAPELTSLNPEFAKLIPVSKALARRNVIAGQHNPIGLDELAALDAGVNFMTHGNWEGGLIPIIQRLTKMPYAGQKLRQAGATIGSSRVSPLIGAGAGAAANLLEPQLQQ